MQTFLHELEKGQDWLNSGYVPLPKSVTPSRIIENADLYDFELSKDDVEKLATNAYEHLSWDPTVEPLDK